MLILLFTPLIILHLQFMPTNLVVQLGTLLSQVLSCIIPLQPYMHSQALLMCLPHT